VDYSDQKRSRGRDWPERGVRVDQVEDAEHDQHDRNGELHREAEADAERDLENDYRAADQQDRQ
jgi:hypothetical protein